MSSYRTIPIPNFLLEYYKDLYENCSSYYNFNDNWDVFGNIVPLPEPKETIIDYEDTEYYDYDEI